MGCASPFVILLLSFFTAFSNAIVATDSKNCSCGFYDAQTGRLFTDSIIAYFNETDRLPTEFIVEDYENKYEKDWNAIYRQGAIPENAQFNVSDTLQMKVSPSTDIHLVNGAGIRTARRDIQHGSFRTLLKAPRSKTGGSAMSMMWKYNETETAEISVMNTDELDDAWVGTFVGGEFTTRDLGVNFSTLLNASDLRRNYTTLGGSIMENGTIDPWEYVEYRIDWDVDSINFYIDGNVTRTVLHRDDPGMPSVPSPFYFKHWSTGNRFSMQGPPLGGSVAQVAWIRMFFNSSSATEEMREDFIARCPISEACSMDDATIRGSTEHAEIATTEWKQQDSKSIKRMPALWISVAAIAFSTCLLVHAFIRRAPWRKQPKTNSHGVASSSSPSTESNVDSAPSIRPQAESVLERQSYEFHAKSVRCSETSAGLTIRASEFKDDLVIEKVEASPGTSVWGDSTNEGPSRPGSLRFDSRGTTPHLLSPRASHLNLDSGQCHPALKSQSTIAKEDFSMSRNMSQRTIAVPVVQAPEDKIRMETVTESALPAPRMRAQPPPPRQRVDYLAGLVAMCAILVTVMHFGLTFVPGMIIPGAPRHYKSELWAQQFIAPFILNQMWLGVFFTTSVRFLVAAYLKKGNLKDIAKAAVRRIPRLMIPVASIALLQYFLIDVGATTYLRYIPSITWSTWPYVTRYPTFGHYVSEVLELVYLVPNAVPQITYNYCTGVLWTIAVQLQGSWLVLCGAIVVYEIKTPWKRMCYYAFAMISHWYAQSWGSYLWLGLLLTDLDITYGYRKRLHARPFVYFALITFFWLCVAAGFSANIIPSWVDFNFTVYEHGIHPDPTTGEPIMNTPRAGYPEYYVPRLNGLLFAGGMQAIVELSPTVQWIFSLPFLLVLFPHIFTIYLMHGVVFWSWGSWLMVFIAERGFGFGLNVTIVGITSYVLLFSILPIVTPIIEALGKDTTALIWLNATEKSPPRRRTLFPFPDDLFSRWEKGDDVEAYVGSGSVSSLDVKKSPEIKAMEIGERV